MKSILRLRLVCAVAALASLKVSGADPQPLLAKPGKPLFEDDFSRAEMAPKWKVGKGFFNIQDGVVIAAENPDDKHGAYAYVNPRFDYKDIIAEFSFKLDGVRACHLMMSDSNYKDSHAGHILRATVTPTQVQLVDMKFGGMKLDIFDKMKDPATTPEEKKQLQASIKDKSAAFKIELDPAKMHQARVEVVGDEMLMSIDGKPAGYLKSEGLNHPTKNMLGFEIGGKSIQLDNVKAWEATASPDWAGQRAAVVGALQKAP
jgi:hypothetical protein